ncbi:MULTISPECIES: cytochrome b [Sphingosinicellaceae]|uniref:cytochrome b n=1 Tax=Sphingosinicellaceae TaxID=2820280 RepID=UPI001C1E6D81|nr:MULTISPECIES: cytochrome b/b6 domain-containing protein [Polymorphobacter]QYE33100.1 cytochrome b/b6 domain-containing protein [Polymorphobacter sp. PAMC 29334]UAJ12341.1 cytochrome b/b6 domain-containing protein [Polymorphobacter megasporae]
MIRWSGPPRDPVERYDRRTIAAHWLVAALVIGQWASGRTIDWFPKGAPRIDARSVHLVLGTLLTAALIYRLYWRLGRGRRFPVDAGSIDGRVAAVMQAALYATLVVVVGLGLWNEALRGDSLFNVISLPKFGAYAKEARHLLSNQVTTWHSLAANLLLILAGLHAAAALVHHYVLRDGTLQRMLQR